MDTHGSRPIGHAFKIWMRAASTGLIGAGFLSGCVDNTGYNSAFASSTALTGNSQSFIATTDQLFKAAKITLVQQGFAIEQTDAVNGLIKGIRALQDPKQSKIAYLVTATIDVTSAPSGIAAVVTASASQQTVLHKDSQRTIVRKEGNITDPVFYKDLFEALAANLPKRPSVTTYPVPPADPAMRVPVAPQHALAAGKHEWPLEMSLRVRKTRILCMYRSQNGLIGAPWMTSLDMAMPRPPFACRAPDRA